MPELAYIPEVEWTANKQKMLDRGVPAEKADDLVSQYYLSKGLDAKPMSLPDVEATYQTNVNKVLMKGVPRQRAEELAWQFHTEKGIPVPEYPEVEAKPISEVRDPNAIKVPSVTQSRFLHVPETPEVASPEWKGEAIPQMLPSIPLPTVDIKETPGVQGAITRDIGGAYRMQPKTLLGQLPDKAGQMPTSEVVVRQPTGPETQKAQFEQILAGAPVATSAAAGAALGPLAAGAFEVGGAALGAGLGGFTHAGKALTGKETAGEAAVGTLESAAGFAPIVATFLRGQGINPEVAMPLQELIKQGAIPDTENSRMLANAESLILPLLAGKIVGPATGAGLGIVGLVASKGGKAALNAIGQAVEKRMPSGIASYPEGMAPPAADTAFLKAPQGSGEIAQKLVARSNEVRDSQILNDPEYLAYQARLRGEIPPTTPSAQSSEVQAWLENRANAPAETKPIEEMPRGDLRLTSQQASQAPISSGKITDPEQAVERLIGLAKDASEIGLTDPAVIDDLVDVAKSKYRTSLTQYMRGLISHDPSNATALRVLRNPTLGHDDFIGYAKRYDRLLNLGENTVNKQPWEMTLDEYRDNTKNSTGTQYRPYATSGGEIRANKGIDITHKALVQDALKRGENVPPEVLSQYPDIAERVKHIEEVIKQPIKKPPSNYDATQGAEPYEKPLFDRLVDEDVGAAIIPGKAKQAATDMAAKEPPSKIMDSIDEMQLRRNRERENRHNKIEATRNDQEINRNTELLTREYGNRLGVVPDANGDRILVHGSSEFRSKFEPSQSEKAKNRSFYSDAVDQLGSFFTDNIEVAKMYGPALTFVKVRMKNPLIITGEEWFAMRGGVLGKAPKQFGKRGFGDTEYMPRIKKWLLDNGYDGLIIRPIAIENKSKYPSGLHPEFYSHQVIPINHKDIKPLNVHDITQGAEPYEKPLFDRLVDEDVGAAIIPGKAKQAATDMAAQVIEKQKPVDVEIVRGNKVPTQIGTYVRSAHKMQALNELGLVDDAANAGMRGAELANQMKRTELAVGKLLGGDKELTRHVAELTLEADARNLNLTREEIASYLDKQPGMTAEKALRVERAYSLRRRLEHYKWQEAMLAAKKITPEQADLYRALFTENLTDEERLSTLTQMVRMEWGKQAATKAQQLEMVKAKLEAAKGVIEPSPEFKKKMGGYRLAIINLEKKLAALEDKAAHDVITQADAGLAAITAPSYREGHFTHNFHENMIYLRPKEGAPYIPEWSQGGGRSIRDAIKIIEANRGNIPKGETPVIVPKSNRPKVGETTPQKTEIGLTGEETNLGQKELQLTVEQAQKIADKIERPMGSRFTNKNRFLGSMLERKGAPGFDTTDFMQSWHSDNRKVARYISMQPFKRDSITKWETKYGVPFFTDLNKSIRDNRLRENAQLAKDYILRVNGMPTEMENRLNSTIMDIANYRFMRGLVGDRMETTRPVLKAASKIKNLVSFLKLGGFNISTGLVNAGQTMLTMSKADPDTFARALKDLWNIRFGKGTASPEAREARILLRKLGISDQVKQAVTPGSFSTYDAMNKFVDYSTLPFQWAESGNRLLSGTEAYYRAIKNGMPRVGKPGWEKTLKFVRDENIRETQFDYSVADSPPLFQNPVFSVMFQFGQYPIKYLEYLSGLTGKEWGKWAVPTLLMSGWHGVPMSADGVWAIEKLSGVNLENELNKYLAKKISEASDEDDRKKWQMFATQVKYGLPGFAGVDLARRMAGADTPLGLSNLSSKAMGPFASTAYNFWRNVGQYNEGTAEKSDIVGAIGAGPKAVYKAYQWASGDPEFNQEFRHGELVKEKSTGEKVMDILGTQKVSMSEATEVQKAKSENERELAGIKKRLTMSFLRDKADEQDKWLTKLQNFAEKEGQVNVVDSISQSLDMAFEMARKRGIDLKSQLLMQENLPVSIRNMVENMKE